MKVIRLQINHVDVAAKILDKNYFDSLEEAKEWILSKERPKKWFVAVQDDQVVGVMGYNIDYSHYANYLEDLAVNKQCRRQGIATELLHKFVEESRKNQPKTQPYCLSSTDVTNKASIKMHLRFGFKKLGTIKGLHYGKNEIFFGYKVH